MQRLPRSVHLPRERVEYRLGDDRVQPALPVRLEEVVPGAQPAGRQPRRKKRPHLPARAEPCAERHVPPLLQRLHQPPRPVEQQQLPLVVRVPGSKTAPVACTRANGKERVRRRPATKEACLNRAGFAPGGDWTSKNYYQKTSNLSIGAEVPL